MPSIRELAAELVVNPRTVRQAYGELEREGVLYVRRGQGTFVSPAAGPDDEGRRALARSVAKRAVLDAHRNGLGVEELVAMIREVSTPDGDEAGMVEPTPGAGA